MNSTNSHALSISVDDPENFDPTSNMQYRPPDVHYTAGPPPSIQVTRHIAIDAMRGHIAAEFAWFSELEADLENLGVHEDHIAAVVLALANDIWTSHPSTAHRFSHFSGA